MPPPAHHHLVFSHPEAAQRLDLAHLQRVPGNVVVRPGAVIDEVVVVHQLRIEHHFPFRQHQRPQQPLGHEEVERVVDGGAGDHREVLLDPGPHFVRRGMVVGEEDVAGHGQPLRRGLDVVVAEVLGDLRLHAA